MDKNKDVEKLKLEKAELVRALKFYSSKENWIKGHSEYGNALLPSNAMLDAGHLARKVLKTID